MINRGGKYASWITLYMKLKNTVYTVIYLFSTTASAVTRDFIIAINYPIWKANKTHLRF